MRQGTEGDPAVDRPASGALPRSRFIDGKPNAPPSPVLLSGVPLRILFDDEATTVPHSEEDERAVLAAMLLDQSVNGPPAADFHVERHQHIRAALASLRERGVPADIRTLASELRELGQLNAAGGLAYLAGLDVDLPDLGNVDHYNRNVRELARIRRLEAAAAAVVLAARRNRKALDAATAQLRAELERSPAASGPAYRSLADLLGDPEVLRTPAVVIARLAWAGRTVLFAAPPKGGKSETVCSAASAVSSGGFWLGERCMKGPVLWVALEEHVGDVARRARKYGADPSLFFILDRVPGGLGDIEMALRGLSPALMVVDTLAALAAGKVDDSNSSAQWTPIMTALARMAHDSKAAVVLLHHSRKSDGRYRDSSAIAAGVDVVVEMTADTADDQVRRLDVQGRFPVEDFSIRYDGCGFAIDSGELSIDARVLAFITRNRGCSMAQVKAAVTGRASTVVEAVHRLVDQGAVRDAGTRSRGSALEASGTASGTAPREEGIPA